MCSKCDSNSTRALDAPIRLDASEETSKPKIDDSRQAALIEAIKNGRSCPTCSSQINFTSVHGVSLSLAFLDEAADYTPEVPEDDLTEMNYSIGKEGFSDFETGCEQAIDLEQIGENS